MASISLTAPTTNNEPSRWMWLLLILSIMITLVAGMIYTQQMMQQVENIEQKQVSLNKSRAVILSQPDAMNINWMRTLNPLAKNIQGDIVWSNSMQQGMIRFANLATLPKGQQYHLWIYDLANAANKPVSIVQFSPDSALPTERLIPFTSSQAITAPYKFMIMLEYTDGDSAPEPLLLAQP